MSRADVLLVRIDSTSGWRSGTDELEASLRRAGAVVRSVHTGPVPRVRTFALTDYTQARLARGAALRGIAEHEPRAVIYCSIVAALLWPRAGAIFLDSIAAANRPGRHGAWQRPVERRRLAQAPLILAWSRRSLEPIAGRARLAPVVVTSPPVDPAPAGTQAGGRREIDAITYAGDPDKRRLGHLLDAWEAARRPGERLVVAGVDGVAGTDVDCAGRIPRAEFLALLRRARVYLAAPRREDYGIAALEALAAGCLLVTAPAPGPYPALDLARALDPRLVLAGTDDSRALGGAVRLALDDPRPDYAKRAAILLESFSTAELDRTVAGSVLPRLLTGSRASDG